MDLPKTCCKNVGIQGFVSCDKPATHWYLHDEDICSYCEEHDYQCGLKIDMTPVSNRADFIKKYKSQDAWKIPVEEFIRRSPDFKGDIQLAKLIGVLMADLEFALRFPT